jgi:hypothetical protein
MHILTQQKTENHFMPKCLDLLFCVIIRGVAWFNFVVKHRQGSACPAACPMVNTVKPDQTRRAIANHAGKPTSTNPIASNSAHQ